jgi:AcrR family transcriptional regulator
LVAAAAKLFNSSGYHGTDSNRIAHAAGYSPGTFYKHFADKREILLAAYERWVLSEWEAVDQELAGSDSTEKAARRLVELTIGFHTKWRGLRASIQELALTDAKVRQFYRKQRRSQLDVMAQLRARSGAGPRSREEDAIHLFTMERCCDAIARNEWRDLGLDREAMIAALTVRVLEVLR